MNAQFLLQPDAFEAVATSQRAIIFDMVFAGRKQRYPLGPLWRIRQARQHQVNDIVQMIVIAPGDVDLLAGNGV